MSAQNGIMVIEDADELSAFVHHHEAALVFFHAPDCGVCHVLWPKVKTAVGERFPRMRQAEVDVGAAPRAAAEAGVFTAPTVVVWFEGNESLRFSRAFSLPSLLDAIERPYTLLFS